MLTPRHIAFVDEFMKDRNAAAAYVRAGYAARGANANAARLIAKDSIAAEIRRRVEKYSTAAGLEAVAILEETKKIAFSDIREAFDPETGALLPIHKIPEKARAAIRSIKMTEVAGRCTKQVRLWDKLAALFKLLEYLKTLPPGQT